MAIKQVSIKQSDGTYSSYDIGANANNIYIDENHTLADKAAIWDNGGGSGDTEEHSSIDISKIFNKSIIPRKNGYSCNILDKKWNGLALFNSQTIWTDGENIYCSNDSKQYVLDKSTGTWNPKTWNGLTSFDADNVWTDGDNTYCSNDSEQYVLDKSTSTWSVKTWNGLISFYGNNIWTDGENIYYSGGTNQYVFIFKLSSTSVKLR